MSEPLNVRASSAGRFVRCPGSVTLPQAASDSNPARLGTAVHELLGAMVTDGFNRDAIKPCAARHDVDAEELERLYWAGKALWEANSAYYHAPRVEVEMQTTLTGLTLTGHADVVSIIGEGRPRGTVDIMIADWKSGWRDDDHFAQLRTYALLALECVGPSDEVRSVYVSIFWLRDRSTETVEFTRAELLAWRETLITAAGLAHPSNPSFSVGDHCHYCPAIGCPLMKSQAIALAEPAALEISADNAAQLYAVANALEKRCDEVKRAVAQFVTANGPVAAADGKALKMVDSTRETIMLTEESALMLTQVMPLDALYNACTVSKTKVADVVRAGAGKGQKQHAVDELMDGLRELGAVNETHSQGLKLVRGEAAALKGAQ